ncbi:MAG TPA: glycoside hydrolase family 38 C-terminal domain-containing protein [Planctomycetota bacterium]|nr:glycoside hydrolase family 38 C-terminal domain-containing protein [Planctomycetota bacterium]
MSFAEELDRALCGIDGVRAASEGRLGRLKAEVRFAAALAEANPGKKKVWQRLILRAVSSFGKALSGGTPSEQALEAAEKILAPVGKRAKQYTLHCVGHGHIDMNWMWNWPETVAIVNDTFTTVDRLMDEFPDFKFSQSQASVYHILKTYLPELWARVKQRVAEGRWEVTASTWVEGDKNLASGEILCRHLLYTRRFLKDELGLAPDDVKIDWSPDTFGHAWSVPTVLAAAGVTRYYCHRAEYGPWLFWWEAKDGSRVLTFDDCRRGYNCAIDETVVKGLLDFEKETGLRDFLLVYGVGDHGGGPTRRHLANAVEMNTWPVWPKLRFSTTDAFFRIAEKDARDLPVVRDELNFVLEGCYTSQSAIKAGNRMSENRLVEAETLGLLGRALAEIPQPDLAEAWRHACFLQFHDILPGSCTHDSAEYASGLYQEVLTQTSMAKTRALRAIADRVDTRKTCGCVDVGDVGQGLGGGPGDVPFTGAVSRRGGGGKCCDPFVVFNPTARPRSEVVTVRLWGRDYGKTPTVVTDDAGETFAGQTVATGRGWGHHWIDVAFPAREVPALGWRTFAVRRAAKPLQATGCTSDRAGVIENEFFRLEVDRDNGAVGGLVHKATGVDLLGGYGSLGVLLDVVEAQHGMSSWMFGQTLSENWLSDGWTLEPVENGPHRASVRLHSELRDSTLTYTISVSARSPRIDFELDVNWLERGKRGETVPTLRAMFPMFLLDDTRATYEIPFGFIGRPADADEIKSWSPYYAGGHYFADSVPIDRNPGEVPALRWADLTGTFPDVDSPVGMTLLNDSKYGHRADDDTLSLTLLRSSADPDPLPEMGRHVIRYALIPHVGEWTPSDATREAEAFNNPLSIVSTDVHDGTLPATKGFAEVLTPNVHLAGMKRAEGSDPFDRAQGRPERNRTGDALIVRLYEMEGKPTTAKMRLDAALARPAAAAVQTDVLERPLATNTARIRRGVLSVDVPAFGVVTVKIV